MPPKKCHKGGLASAQYGYLGLDSANYETGIQHLNNVNAVGSEVVAGFDAEHGMSGEHNAWVPHNKSSDVLAVGGSKKKVLPYEKRTKADLLKLAEKKKIKGAKAMKKDMLIKALRK